MRNTFSEILIFVFLLIFLVVNNVFASMSSTNYRVDWDNISVGGSDTGSSSSYLLRDSIGDVGSGNSTSTSYQVDSGYRAGVYDKAADFSVYIQDRESQVASTAITATTVTLGSTSNFSAGDYIIVVQNEGQNQVSAVGKISSISSPIITVDFWTYSSSMPTIDNSNDYAYALDASTVSLGTLVPGNISTAVIGWDVSAEVDDGYSVYIYEDGNLQSGANTIDDVSDGSVSGVNDEYGARSSDTSLASSTFDTLDSAITTTPTQIASESAAIFSKRGFLTLKATVDGTIPVGTYSQSLMFMYVGDY